MNEILSNNEPRPIGEVIQDLIREGMILPKYKSNKDEKDR